MAQLKGPVFADNERMREEIKNLNMRILNQQRDIAGLKNASDAQSRRIADDSRLLYATRLRAAWLAVVAAASLAVNAALIAINAGVL